MFKGLWGFWKYLQNGSRCWLMTIWSFQRSKGIYCFEKLMLSSVSQMWQKLAVCTFSHRHLWVQNEREDKGIQYSPYQIINIFFFFFWPLTLLSPQAPKLSFRSFGCSSVWSLWRALLHKDWTLEGAGFIWGLPVVPSHQYKSRITGQTTGLKECWSKWTLLKAAT